MDCGQAVPGAQGGPSICPSSAALRANSRLFCSSPIHCTHSALIGEPFQRSHAGQERQASAAGSCPGCSGRSQAATGGLNLTSAFTAMRAMQSSGLQPPPDPPPPPPPAGTSPLAAGAMASPTDLEVQRAQRMAQNRRKMEEMGLVEASRGLAASGTAAAAVALEAGVERAPRLKRRRVERVRARAEQGGV